MLSAFKFNIQCVQTDNGFEFTKQLKSKNMNPTMFENYLKQNGKFTSRSKLIRRDITGKQKVLIIKIMNTFILLIYFILLMNLPNN